MRMSVRPQTTVARLLLATILVGLLVIVTPAVYNSRANSWGNILSIVLVAVVFLGGFVGLIFGGVENFFRGVVIGILLFAAAILILIVAGVILTVMNG
jgi:hypothetical protein